MTLRDVYWDNIRETCVVMVGPPGIETCGDQYVLVAPLGKKDRLDWLGLRNVKYDKLGKVPRKVRLTPEDVVASLEDFLQRDRLLEEQSPFHVGQVVAGCPRYYNSRKVHPYLLVAPPHRVGKVTMLTGVRGTSQDLTCLLGVRSVPATHKGYWDLGGLVSFPASRVRPSHRFNNFPTEDVAPVIKAFEQYLQMDAAEVAPRLQQRYGQMQAGEERELVA